MIHLKDDKNYIFYLNIYSIRFYIWIVDLIFAADLAPDLNERREGVAEEESTMEVNCNGHVFTPESKVHRTEQSTEEQEDQQNANQPENTGARNILDNKEEPQTSNCSPEDPDTQLEQLPASHSPNSVAVELKERNKKEEEMDTQKETKQANEDEDSQNG